MRSSGEGSACVEAPTEEGDTPLSRVLSSVDVVVVRKQSAVERFGSVEDRHRRAHDSLFEVLDILCAELKKMGHTHQVLTLDELQNSGLAFFKPESALSAHERTPLLYPRARLAISVGGDGTLLHASHYIGGPISLLGVNAFPKTSVGHLCLARQTNVRDILARISEETLQPRLVHRLMMTFLPDTPDTRSRRSLPLALNDILVCSAHPAATSKYHLTVLKTNAPPSAKISAIEGNARPEQRLERAFTDLPGKAAQVLSEEHVCSGAWIATAAGSTAAISSYGLQRLPLDSSDFLFAAREPYFRPQNFSILDRAAFRGSMHQLLFTSRMATGLVAVDGADFTDAFDQGDTVCISMEPQSGIKLYV